jgi:hypothetical protein
MLKCILLVLWDVTPCSLVQEQPIAPSIHFHHEERVQQVPTKH